MRLNKLGYVLVFKCSIMIIGHKNCLNNISWQELECSNCNCLSQFHTNRCFRKGLLDFYHAYRNYSLI